MPYEKTTIAAIATAPAAGGISIVRISGEKALSVADKIFKTKKGLLLSNSEGYRAYYGRVYSKGKPVDEAICLIFKGPKSFTGEDTAEIHCHGGIFVSQSVLRAALDAGALAAQAGEFTKRAYLNGRLSLDRAEAVMSLVCAQGDQAAKAALNVLEGALAQKINESVAKLTRLAAGLSAWVDFPDEDIEDTSPQELRAVFIRVLEDLKSLADNYDKGRAVINGVETVIVGRPNVGKSTLMNLLAGYEKSIVTDFAGTTRDIVEETVMLGPLVLHMADTAGLRDTDNPVERIGVERALKKLDRASLILAVFDGSDVLTDDDKMLLEKCAGRPTLALINKTDLPRSLDLEYIRGKVDKLVEISASKGEGLAALEKAALEVLGSDTFDPTATMVANERQRSCILRAIKMLEEALKDLDRGMTFDALALYNDAAIEALLELKGEKVSDAVVDEIFSSFCVGK